MAKPSLSDFVKIEDNIVSSTVPIDLEGKTLAKELFAVLEAETDKVVIVDSVTGQTWTGNEALRDVKRLASALIAEGMKKGQIVAVLTDDKYPGLNAILFMAVVAAGAVYEGGDFRYPEREMHVLLENSDVEYIIASETTVETVLKAAAGIDRIKKVYLIDPPSSESTPLFPRLFDLPPGGNVQLPVPVDQHDPAVQGFSSGTTGTPKTIVKSQRSAVFYKGMGHAPFFFGGRPGDTVLVPVPLYHLSDVALLVNVLLNGSTVILHSHTVKTTPVAAATRATSAFIVTSEATFLAKDPIEVDLKLTDIIIAGSVLSKEIGLSFMQRYKVPKLRNTYGASETGWTTMLPYFYDSDDFAC
ncbi:4-coumarate--CoA ligase 3 [Halotydeus destructor]|nr:4-coumarate--CoA ligase 3 [Halotydeus destructor]